MSQTKATNRYAPLRELSSGNAKLVYLFLHDNDGATADDLRESLGLGQMTVYSLLRTLTEQGLVEKSDTTYTTRRGQTVLTDGGTTGCADCTGEVINVQGLNTCPNCGWTGS